MSKLSLICVDKGRPKHGWLLHLTDESGQLVDPDGNLLAQFRHAEAQTRFEFPSFWKSIEDLGVIADDGLTIWFYADRGHLAEIKYYLARSLAAQGPEVIQAQRRQAFLEIWGGLAVMPLAIAGIVVFLLLAEEGIVRTIAEWIGKWVVVMGIAVFALGGATVGHGLALRRRTRKAVEEYEAFS